MQASTRHVGRCFFCSLRPLTTSRAFSTARPSCRELRITRTPHDRPQSGNRRPGGNQGGKQGLIRKNLTGPKPKFSDVLFDRLNALKDELHQTPIGQKLDKDGSFRNVWKAFVKTISISTFVPGVAPTGDKGKEHQALRDAFYDKGVNSLDDRIKYAFYDHVTTARFTSSDIRNQKALADLRYPTEWFPSTRTIHRTIHLHVGPTNSGKTYHALQRLEKAESGVYAGPLRLLAHEIYTRLNAKGKRCILVTGEEKRSPDDTLSTEMSSCTVEMMPLNKTVDVAVIDEIQMIGNAERGWAWTQAVLGVKAREVHLCGEARTVPLIRELCASIGEKLIVHEYKRLSPLEMSDKALNGNLKLLRKGDCIVSFSVMGIHALRKQIEKVTGKKVATVYGSLPPETRAQQARLFNDPDNDYDFLVASDAIGMGLNLSIKRVIFETSSKFDGFKRRTLAVPDIKQIAGRAGRYRSAFQANKSAQSAASLAEVKGEPEPGVEVTSQSSATPSTETTGNDQSEVATSQSAAEVISETPATQDESMSAGEKSSAKSTSEDQTVGLVTTLENYDLPVIASAMKTEPDAIRSAGLFPPAPIVERFASYFPPGTPFSYILMRLHELSQVHSRFHLCGLRDQLWIADLIEPVQGLTTTDRNILCACPASKSEADLYKQLIPALARCIEQQTGGSLIDLKEMPLEVLELEVSPNREYLRQLERLHKGLVTYLWLSYRFAGIFTTRPLAFHVKAMVEERIETVLYQFSFTENQRKKIVAAREKSMIDDFRREIMSGSELEGQKAASELDSQTSLSAGGDQFSGESDLDVMDPAERLADQDTESIAQQIADSDVSEDLPARGSEQEAATSEMSETKVELDSIEAKSSEPELSSLGELNLAHDIQAEQTRSGERSSRADEEVKDEQSKEKI